MTEAPEGRPPDVPIGYEGDEVIPETDLFDEPREDPPSDYQDEDGDDQIIYSDDEP